MTAVRTGCGVPDLLPWHIPEAAKRGRFVDEDAINEGIRRSPFLHYTAVFLAGKENPPGEGGLSPATKEGSLDHLIIIKVERGKTSCPEGIFCWSYPLDNFIIRKNYGKSMALTCELHQIFHIRISRIESEFSDNCSSTILVL